MTTPLPPGAGDPSQPVPAPIPSAVPAEAVAAGSAVAAAPAPPWILQVWARLRREPTLMLTVAYLGVSSLGLWASYWFYRGFGLPILEYMQPSDFLVAGLREPIYALLLLGSVAFAWVISWPDTYRQRHPAQVEAWRQHWWGRQVFPESRWFRWKLFGISPETGIAVVAALYMVWVSASYVQAKGRGIRESHVGQAVTLARADGSPPREARLLGTSGSFVFVWWPDARVAEAIPIETVQGLVSHPRVEPKSARPQARPAGPDASAAPTAAAAAPGAGGAARDDAKPAR